MKKNKKHQEKIHCFKAAIPAMLFVIYVIFDYLNVPQSIGLSSERINTDFFAVFLNSVIVVVLYIISYYLVDRRQIQKDANSKDTANILLLYTYKECLKNLQIVGDSEVVKEFIFPKVDVNKPVTENKIIMNLQCLPFSSKREILELSKIGCVDKDVLARYLHIQQEYNHIITMKIIFFDLNNPQTAAQKALFKDIQQRDNELKSLLGNEIKRLEEHRDGSERKAI